MKLALGTVQFGVHYGVANLTGRVACGDAREILDLASRSGIDTLDTAIAYGDSETVLGSVGVQSWKVVTKLPGIPDNCVDVQIWVRSQVLASLKRLGVGQIYGLLLHRPEQLLESRGADLFCALKSLKSEGLVNKIGISVYNHKEIPNIFDRYVFDLIQAPLNIIDRSLVESGCAHDLKRAGVEIHCRSIFLQGLLLMPPHSRPLKFARWYAIWAEWDHWLKRMGLTALQACVRYATALDCVDRIVVGVDSKGQLSQIVNESVGRLPTLPTFQAPLDDRLLNPTRWGEI